MNSAETFKEIAKTLGHDLNALNNGKEITTYIRIPTMPEARKILSRASEIQRKKRSSVFYTGIESRQRLPQGMHDRGEEYTHANGHIHSGDKKGLSNHFPIRVKVISIKEKVIKKDEVWDVSIRHDFWGVDYMEELYTVINIETLILEPNAQLNVKGNVFSLSCQNIIRTGEESITSAYDIGILPTPFSVDLKRTSFHGKHGENGYEGYSGRPGEPIDYNSTFLGPELLNKETVKVNGTSGTGGENGHDGACGRNGGMCKIAEIHIGNLINFENHQLRIYSKPGDGGNGGNGGNGGKGGNGGHGADGIKAINGNITPGIGGNGGNGGDGGSGGNGGSGGIASNIFIEVPEHLISKIKTISLPSHGGNGGKAGQNGSGGNPGNSGAVINEKASQAGADGKAGVSGMPGKAGRAGKGRPGANIFINGLLDKSTNENIDRQSTEHWVEEVDVKAEALNFLASAEVA